MAASLHRTWSLIKVFFINCIFSCFVRQRDLVALCKYKAVDSWSLFIQRIALFKIAYFLENISLENDQFFLN